MAVLINLSLSAREAGLIFVLFATQLAVPIPEVRVGFGALYILLALIWAVSERAYVPGLFRAARRSLSGNGDGATHATALEQKRGPPGT